ncbi:hypothetical protein ABPG72_010592 [Tetrahymena utriculariae]
MSEINQQQKLISEFNNCIAIMKQNLNQKNFKLQSAQITQSQQRGIDLLEQIQNRFRTTKFPIQDRSKAEKLKKDFEGSATDFQKQCQVFLDFKKLEYDEQRETYKNSLNHSSINPSVNGNLESYYEESAIDDLEKNKQTSNQNLEMQQSQKQPTQEEEAAHPDLQFQLEMMKEKNDGIKKVQKDIMQVDQIMKDINRLVVEQGEVIDEIGENVQATKQNVIKANKELTEAKSLNEVNKKRKCLLLLLLVIIIAIIVIPIAVLS